MDFKELFSAATGSDPYPWQRKVATDGLPEVIDIETGAGKTAGVVLGWMYRLLHHEDAHIRATTPSWLVFALPMRSLVDQTHGAICGWLDALGADDIACYRLIGGEGRVPNGWRERPGQATIIVGTVDMVLSRALMRAFASSRWTWPIDFGLLHSGVHYVFDEVQLLGPALATSRQLDVFRRSFGTAAPCTTTWMSATLDADRLRTVDNPTVTSPLQLTDDDLAAGLAARLSATRTVEEVTAGDGKALADVVLSSHRRGTRTLVVLNQVKRAQELASQLRRLAQDSEVSVDLLHSRFRPAERAAIVAEALGAVTPHDDGRILVATQVVEAGVDLSCHTLVTDLAPWSSIVQRAGRCNRAGEYEDARLLWVTPPKDPPYEPASLHAAADALRGLEGHDVTSVQLRSLGRQVHEEVPVSLVLRRRDLVELFDTSSDLVGNDVDVSRFIRDGDDSDIEVAWREPAGREAAGEADLPFLGGELRPDELCRVAIGQARSWLRSDRVAWVPDHLATSGNRWVPLTDVYDLRPGSTVVVAAAAGGYDPEIGWDPSVKRQVPVVATPDGSITPGVEVTSVAEGVADDPASFVGSWVSLDAHLVDAGRDAVALLHEVSVPGLTPAMTDAVVRAAQLHDLGKAHPVFQETLLRSAAETDLAMVEALQPLAKSAGGRGARHARPHFRHELVSALLLTAYADDVLADDLEPDLVRYLVAAHHGRVRLAIRSIPGERLPVERQDARVALGVADGDEVPAVEVGGTVIGPAVLDLEPMVLGSDHCWTTMALGLRDRADLGPFRLATLEALVRLADWRASAGSSSDSAPSGARTDGTEQG